MLITARLGRGLCVTLRLASMLAVMLSACEAQQALVISDFEDGLGTWQTERAPLPGGEDPGDIVSLYVSSKTHDGGGRGCLFATFRAASRATARIATQVDGAALLAAGGQDLAFWVRPYGAGSSVQMVFSGADSAGVSHEFIATLHLAEADWTQVRVPLGKFTENGIPMGDALDSVDAFAFRKTGTWDHFYFRVDDVVLGSGASSPQEPVASQPEGPDEVDPGQPRPDDEGPAPDEAPDEPIAPEDVLPPDRPLGPLDPVEPVVGPTEAPEVAVLPAPGEEFGVAVTVDFAQPMVPYRPALGGSVVPEDAPLLEDPAVAQRLQALGLTILRVRLTVPPDFALSDETLALLDRVVACRDATGARSVMICLDLPFSADLDGARLGEFAASLATRYNKEKQTPVAYWEIFNAPAFLGKPDQVRASEIAETVAAALRATDAGVRPGGLGFANPTRDKLHTLMSSAPGMAFYSWHFYGSHFIDTPPDELMGAARAATAYDAAEAFGPADVEKLLVETFGQADKLLFVTECNSNSVRTGEVARDPRLMTSLNSAWVASALVSFAPYVDVVFLSRLVGDGWGILKADGEPCPAYWAVFLASRYARRGSQLCLTNSSDLPVRALATKGEGTRHVLLVNQRNAPALVTLSALGLSVNATVRGLLVQETTANALPISPLRATYQPIVAPADADVAQADSITATVPDIVLPPFGVVAVEFDESEPYTSDAPTVE